MRTQRFTAVEITAQIPLTVPRMVVEVLLQQRRLLAAQGGDSDVLALFCQCAITLQNVVEEKAQPDTFPAPAQPHQIHAVIPVSRAHQRQSVLTHFQTMLQRTHTVLPETFLRCADLRLLVERLLTCLQQTCLEIRHGFFGNAMIAGDRDVMADGQRQPEIVVRTAGTHAVAGWRMPPVLDIAFNELPRRT